ncbi:MAG: VanZ family protein [Flavobacterium sp.]|nr:MAG: VanZ family protein [Flavobacterium sp.]
MLLTLIRYFPMSTTRRSLAGNRIFLVIALSWTALITFLCLVNSQALPGIEVENVDKWVHGSLYFFFTLFWFFFFRTQLAELELFRILQFVFLISGLFGVMIELAQEFFTTTRQADIDDVFANMTGSLIAVLMLYVIDKFRQSRQLPG